MRIETKTAVLLMAFVLVVAAFAIPTTVADAGKMKKVVNSTEGGGKINSTVMPNVSTFGFEAKNITDKKGNEVKGNLQYNDHGAKIKLHGNVTTLAVNKTLGTATFTGFAKVTNSTGAKMEDVLYTVNVIKGKKGVGNFQIIIPIIPGFLPAGYTDTGTLLGGDIKVDP